MEEGCGAWHNKVSLKYLHCYGSSLDMSFKGMFSDPTDGPTCCKFGFAQIGPEEPGIIITL